MTELSLTKTDYLLYRQAPLHLWAAAHSLIPDAPPPAQDLHSMRQGLAIEPHARRYLEQVVLPGYPAASLAWQPTHRDGPYEIRADALIRHDASGVVDIYEIKAVNNLDAEHIEDAAFQALVLQASHPVGRVFIVHLNKDYVRGETLDLAQLFLHTDITAEVHELLPVVALERARALEVLQAADPLTDAYCDKPAECPCPAVCHPDLPAFSIYNIPRLKSEKRRELRGLGILAAADVPADYKISANQRAAVRLAQTGQPEIAAEEIRAALAGLQWPLWFLDYESLNASLPRFPGYRPYQHIVFQYSLHCLTAPDAEPQHYEYLGLGPEDPALGLLESLSAALGSTGSVLVWNKGFEASRNRELAALHPAYALFLESVNERIFDLMEIVSKGHYQHPGFGGSASIKQVLPVLVPTLSYDSLPISGGSQTMLAWDDLTSGKTSPAEAESTRTAMLDYCRLDTLAMLELWKVFAGV